LTKFFLIIYFPLALEFEAPFSGNIIFLFVFSFIFFVGSWITFNLLLLLLWFELFDSINISFFLK
jgi:hypothetical protein